MLLTWIFSAQLHLEPEGEGKQREEDRKDHWNKINHQKSKTFYHEA